MNMEFLRKLPTPKEIKELYPLTLSQINKKEENDKEIKNILNGSSNKLLLIIGPCSADREDAVLDYLHRLRKVQEKVKDNIFIVPRVFTNKPRTKGDGYKGMLHQPDPHMNEDILKGLIKTRELHTKVLEETGFTCADEMLYPENHRYLSDLLSYASVGARSVEDQQHRLTASGLNIPVGLKNPTNGSLDLLISSINACHHSYKFIYRGWEVISKGNPYAHAILRGYTDSEGVTHSNYKYEDLIKLKKLYEEANLENASVIIDTNHSNSNKNYLKQIDIANDVLDSIIKDPSLKGFVKGLMIESYLEDGNQDEDGNIYGKSITDPCLGWDKTLDLILSLNEKWQKIK